MTIAAALETRAAEVETRLDALISNGGTMAAYTAVLRDAKAMIEELRITFAATDLLARKNIAAVGDDVILDRLMPLVRRKLKEPA